MSERDDDLTDLRRRAWTDLGEAGGEIPCAAPPLTYADGPTEYPALATPWGADPAAWW